MTAEEAAEGRDIARRRQATNKRRTSDERATRSDFPEAINVYYAPKTKKKMRWLEEIAAAAAAAVTR